MAQSRFRTVQIANPDWGSEEIQVELQSGGGRLFKTGASGNVANAAAVATLAAVAAKTNYVTGFQLTGSGATAGLVVDATLVGLLGGTLTFSFAFPAGVLVAAFPLVVNFDIPLPASAPNVAIVLTLPASGAGGAHAAANMQGFEI